MIGGPLGWLVGMSIVSAVTAFVLVHVVGKLFELAGLARVALFSGIWTAVGTMAGMRKLTGTARKLRTNNARVRTLKGEERRQAKWVPKK